MKREWDNKNKGENKAERWRGMMNKENVRNGLQKRTEKEENYGKKAMKRWKIEREMKNMTEKMMLIYRREERKRLGHSQLVRVFW